jgi:hypothetical protein
LTISKDKIRYQHDCISCVFLGRFKEYDLYYCSSNGTPSNRNTVIARYSDEGSEYESGIYSNSSHLIEAKFRAMKILNIDFGKNISKDGIYRF